MDFLSTVEHHILDHTFFNLFQVGGIQFAFTRHVMMMLISSALLIISLPLIARSWPMVPSGPKNFLELFIVFIRDEILIPNAGKEGLPYLPYLLSLFFFILTTNLLGLIPIPGFGTATGNIAVTAGLAACSFGLVNFCGLRRFGLFHHIKNFIPHGVPAWLIPLILPLEMISLVIKSFALCIRLFANMMAGHIVLLAFLSLAFLIGSIWVSFASVPMALGIYMLEVFVAFFQAYIFTFLTALFMGASLNPH